MASVRHLCPALSFAIAACDGSTAAPDGPIAPDAAPGTSISIRTGASPPALVAVRDGLTSPWAVLPTQGTSYTSVVHGPYVATVVCLSPGGGSARIYQFARTPDDDPMILAPCSLPGTVASHEVIAQVVQSGRVAIEDTQQSSTTPNWQLQQVVHEGTHNLVAISADRALVRRNIEITAATDLGTLDLVAEGQPLVATPLTATNVAVDDAVTVDLSLITSLGTAHNIAQTSLAGTQVLPETLLSTNVQQELAVQARQGGDARALHRVFGTGGATEFALPDGIVGGRFTVTGDQIIAHWDALPDHDEVFVLLFGSFGFHTLDLGESFLATTSEIMLDTDIPGFEAAWRIAPNAPHLRMLGGVKNRADGFDSSTYTERISFPAVPHPALEQHLREPRGSARER